MAEKGESTASGAKADGEVYVSSTSVYYTNPRIDANVLLDTIENIYIREQVDRHMALLFPDEPIVTVRDPDGEEDEDLSTHLNSMCIQPSVGLPAAVKRTYVDCYQWGPSILSPGWERKGGEVILTELRRLPPESFSGSPPASAGMRVYNEILPGIRLGTDNTLELWQTQGSGIPILIKNAVVITDPMDTKVGGKSKLIPIVPIVSMLRFSWKAMMQRVNRIGAPSMFIRIKPPVVKNDNRDDIAHAKRILQNYGKDCQQMLRDNMELVVPDLKDNMSALESIKALEDRVMRYCNPAQMLQKEGATIGGNADAQLDLVKLWIKSTHSWIETAYERVIGDYLRFNAFDGYTLEIDIPEPEADMTRLMMEKAQAGYNTRALTTNEIREHLGVAPLEEAELDELADDYAKAQPSMTGLGFQMVPVKQTVTPVLNMEHATTENERELSDELKLHAQKAIDRIKKAVTKEPVPDAA